MNTVTSVECRDGLAIYWISSKDNPKEKEEEFGICFKGEITNIHRQSVVESTLLSVSYLHDDLKQLKGTL